MKNKITALYVRLIHDDEKEVCVAKSGLYGYVLLTSPGKWECFGTLIFYSLYKARFNAYNPSVIKV